MARGVDEANAVVGGFQEGFAGRHRGEDTGLALGPEVLANAATLGYKLDQRDGLVGIELVEDEDPTGVGISVDGATDVRSEVLFRSRRPDGWQNRLACGDLEVGDEAQGAMTTKLELDALGSAGAWRQGGMEPFTGLDAGLLVGANDVGTLLFVEPQGICVGRADVANVGLVLLGVLELVL